MDDFGNFYQDDEWFMHCEQYSHSMNTFGMFDDLSCAICFTYCVDYAAQNI